MSIFILCSCSEVVFETKSNDSTKEAIKALEPALAIRAMGCVTCHADIRSNIITDFGFEGNGRGLNYFFGQTAPSPITPFSGSIYGNHGDSAWQSAKISGRNVIVPEAATLGLVPQATLQEYLQNALDNSTETETKAVRVITKRKIFIGAPSAQRLREIAGSMPAGSSWKYFSENGSTLEGFRLVSGATGSYVTNQGEIVCSGDVFIDGIVYLKQPQVRTTRGCRIYATRSVFIDGPIEYVGNSSGANLQISSARSIDLGLGENTCGAAYSWGEGSLRTRLLTIWTRDGYFTREQGSVDQKLRDIWDDSQVVGGLVDAACTSVGREVEFRALILNAPIINSRYRGNIKGAIIAEVAVMSLGAFKYEFDEVFKVVPVLPLLRPSDYLGFQE